MHSVQKVFVQKPAGVAGRSLGSAGPEDSELLSLQILLSLLYLESQPIHHQAWRTESQVSDASPEIPV